MSDARGVRGSEPGVQGDDVDAHTRRQIRRKVTLESMSLSVPIAAAFFFSGELVVAWPRRVSLLLAAGVAVVLVSFWIWHRRRYPASIAAPSQESEDEASADEDDDGRWDVFTLLLLGVSLVAVVLVGVVGRFILPLLVIVLFGVGYSGSDLGHVVVAAGCMLAVSFVLEFGIVLPLSKRWNLAIDEDPRPREDFCPK